MSATPTPGTPAPKDVDHRVTETMHAIGGTVSIMDGGCLKMTPYRSPYGGHDSVYLTLHDTLALLMRMTGGVPYVLDALSFLMRKDEHRFDAGDPTSDFGDEEPF
jgi:hypothetical protein